MEEQRFGPEGLREAKEPRRSTRRSKHRSLLDRRSFISSTAATLGAVVASRYAFAQDGTMIVPGLRLTTISDNQSWQTHTVAAGEILQFDPTKDTTLEVTGNLVVLGALEMKPNPGVQHTLRFKGVNESVFVGGGMDPVASDVGLWVMGDGQLVIEGTDKEAWNRTGASATWASSDELRVAPTALGDIGRAGFAAFEAGGPVPEVGGQRAEVLNLTRNVVIEGTATGRSHMFIRSNKPQTIRNAVIRHMGPRDSTSYVLGRYAVHFHHSMDGSRGSLVENVVVRNAGSHSFVAHSSHGVTFRNCIAYDVTEDAYWWDEALAESQDQSVHLSHDILYDSCVAASVKAGNPGTRATLLSGFTLTDGDRNVCRNCVAVGVDGGTSSSGFHWPSKSPNGVWVFEDCLAHNNRANGIYAWQNDQAQVHEITNFVAYRNGISGIVHGAYVNLYRYSGVTLYENGWTRVAHSSGLHALARSKSTATPIIFENFVIDGAGLSQTGLYLGVTLGVPVAPLRIVDPAIRGVSTPVRINNATQHHRSPLKADFIRPVIGPEKRDMLPSDIVRERVGAGSLIRVQRQDNQSAWEMDDKGSVREIAPFFS